MSRIKAVYCYITIVLITFLVFYNSLSNEFVFDDESVIVNNVSIQDLSNIPKFFTASEGFHKVIGRYYRPVVSMSYSIDYSIWGLDPYGFHLTNLIIHIICCLLVFRILSVLFWRYKYRNLFALISTLIFAVHPIHTEAVSWVSGRTDSLVTLFFLSSFLCYIEFTKEKVYRKDINSIHSIKRKSNNFLYLSLAFYILGLFTKEMIITLPVILFLYDLVFRQKKLSYFKENLITYSLYIGVTIIYLVLRYFLLLEVPERESYLYFFGKSPMIIYATMIKTLPVYFELLFAPISLLYHYNGVIPDAASIGDSSVILSLIFTLFMLLLAVYFFKKDGIVSFCILFFFVTLLPVMNIIPTMNLMAERFLYITSFSLVLLICHLLLLGSSKRDFSILIIGTVIIIGLLSYLTYLRNEEWHDNNSLYMSAKGIEGSVLLVNEANIYANNKKYSDAEVMYKRAIELRDNNLLAHHNLGLIYLLRGSYDSAIVKFKKGVTIDTLAPDGYYQLASVYSMQNKNDSALIMLEKLQEIFPNYRESAKMLSELKDGKKLRQNPVANVFDGQNPSERINLLQNRSYKNYTEKNYEDAIKDLEELIVLNNDSLVKSGLLNNIAMCYSEMKLPHLEEKYFMEAIKLDRNNTNALSGLALYNLKSGNPAKAKEIFTRILTINPSDENAKRKLDSIKIMIKN